MAYGQQERPFTVTLIALFQFAKAWVLVLIAIVVWKAPDALHGSDVAGTMLFIATHGITAHLWGGNPQAVFLAIFAIYPLAIGIGLWFLRPSARYFLMTICGLTLGYTIRGLFINTALSGTFLYNPALSPALQQPAVFSLLLIDAFILYYLWMGDGVSKAFGSK